MRSADVTFIAIVFPALDRAGHIFGMNDKRTFAQYAVIDGQLATHWRWMRDNPWVVISDHGMTSSENGSDWGHAVDGGERNRLGWHSPDAVLFTNIPDRPEKLSEVYQWLQ